MKNILLCGAFLVALLAAPVSTFAQSDAVLTSPTKSQLESVIGGMDLSMGQKLSLKTILQALREKGEKVLGDNALSKDQKVTQIVQARQGALEQTGKILSAAQQAQLTGVLLPKG